MTLDWVANDVPLQNAEVARDLSGPGSISGTVEPEVGRMFTATGPPGEHGMVRGRRVLEEWGTFLFAEDESGSLRGGGVVETSRFKGPQWRVEAPGFTRYAKGQPYIGKFIRQQVDPLDVVREIWDHLQGFPDGDLGLAVDGTTSNVTIGKTGRDDQPYRLVWWENNDCGQEIDGLARSTPFDYAEHHTWAGPGKTGVNHRMELGFPRLGRKRGELSFVQGENIIEPVSPAFEGTEFGNDGIGLGKGEGRKTVRVRIPKRNGRLRRAFTVVDKSVGSFDRMRSLVRDELRARDEITEITRIVLDAHHPNARYGTYRPGDDILVQAEVPWVGDVALWHRITSERYRPHEGKVTLDLARSDSFAYRGEGTAA